MSFSGILKADATATTNPDPNSLTTPNPYGTYTDRFTPQTDWTTQASTKCNAVVPRDGSNAAGPTPLRFSFIPGDGDAVTMTIKVWEWNHLAAIWQKPQTGHSWSLTGYQSIIFTNPAPVPYFLEVDAISAGNVDIYFDNGAAKAL